MQRDLEWEIVSLAILSWMANDRRFSASTPKSDAARNDAARLPCLPAGTAGDDGANDDDASKHGANGGDDGAYGSGESSPR